MLFSTLNQTQWKRKDLKKKTREIEGRKKKEKPSTKLALHFGYTYIQNST